MRGAKWTWLVWGIGFLLLALPISAVQAYSGYPYFFIKAVIRNHSVEITPYNFPPNDTFIVRMNVMGTRGVGGYVVDTVLTDAAGNLSDTVYPIHPNLWGLKQIAIRLESPYTGYFAYNWFYNNTYPATATPAPTGPSGTGYYGFPFFFIRSVVKDTSVTISPHNFPPNDTFQVRMNYMGTRGVGGILVATVTTDASGNLSSLTYSIPSALAGQYRIAIRLESPTSGYYAFNWFYNNTATVDVP